MSQSAVEPHEPQGEICSPQAAESRAAEENTRKILNLQHAQEVSLVGMFQHEIGRKPHEELNLCLPFTYVAELVR